MAKEAPKTLSENIRYILGVDRLHYTKGLVNRMLAVEKLLEEHQEYIGKIIFLQVSFFNLFFRFLPWNQLKEEVNTCLRYSHFDNLGSWNLSCRILTG